MTHLDTYLTALGLNKEQIDIYLTLSTSEPLTVLQLAQMTEIPRTTIYLYIDEMTAQGIVHLIEEGKKKRYTAANPKELLALIKKKKEEYQEISKELETKLPELETMYYHSGKPKTIFYERKEDIRRFFDEVSKVEKLYMMWTSPVRKEMQDEIEYLYDHIQKHLIHTKEIVLEDHMGKMHKLHNHSVRNEIALLPTSHATHSDTVIMGNKVAFITYTPSPSILVIENKEISHAERVKFNIMWKMYSKE